MHGFRIGQLHCGLAYSIMPDYRKLFRTFVFLGVMAVITAFSLSVDGDWRTLAAFLSALLLVFGIDGFEIQIGDWLYLRVPGDSQTDKQDD